MKYRVKDKKTGEYFDKDDEFLLSKDGAVYIIKDKDSFELENITPDVIVEPIDNGLLNSNKIILHIDIRLVIDARFEWVQFNWTGLDDYSMPTRLKDMKDKHIKMQKEYYLSDIDFNILQKDPSNICIHDIGNKLKKTPELFDFGIVYNVEPKVFLYEGKESGKEVKSDHILMKEYGAKKSRFYEYVETLESNGWTKYK